jgi:hypothetical protein
MRQTRRDRTGVRRQGRRDWIIDCGGVCLVRREWMSMFGEGDETPWTSNLAVLRALTYPSIGQAPGAPTALRPLSAYERRLPSRSTTKIEFCRCWTEKKSHHRNDATYHGSCQALAQQRLRPRIICCTAKTFWFFLSRLSRTV